MNHWLVKQEPEDYAFHQLVADKRTDWTGVRNFQARNNLRAMKKNDRVLYYHSGNEKSVVGLATVTRESFPDPTVDADDRTGEWLAVELSADQPLPRPVALAEIKADDAFKDFALVKTSRLSVMPISRAEFDHLLVLSNR